MKSEVILELESLCLEYGVCKIKFLINVQTLIVNILKLSYLTPTYEVGEPNILS